MRASPLGGKEAVPGLTLTCATVQVTGHLLTLTRILLGYVWAFLFRGVLISGLVAVLAIAATTLGDLPPALVTPTDPHTAGWLFLGVCGLGQVAAWIEQVPSER